MSDWLSACRELQVEGTKDKGSGRKMWNECVNVNKKRLGLFKDCNKWKNLTTVETVQHCLSTVMRVRSFANCVLATLKLLMMEYCFQ